MRSAARCTYTEVHAGARRARTCRTATHFKPLFVRANTLAQHADGHAARSAASIDFDLPETRVELDDDGLPVRLVRRERWESHRLVEECMLAANEAVARFFRERSCRRSTASTASPTKRSWPPSSSLLRALRLRRAARGS